MAASQLERFESITEANIAIESCSCTCVCFFKNNAALNSLLHSGAVINTQTDENESRNRLYHDLRTYSVTSSFRDLYRGSEMLRKTD